MKIFNYFGTVETMFSKHFHVSLNMEIGETIPSIANKPITGIMYMQYKLPY